MLNIISYEAIFILEKIIKNHFLFMRLVIQRVKQANVVIDNKVYSEIQKGLLVLIGFCEQDKQDFQSKSDFLINKILNLRIFEKNGRFDLSLKDVQGDILLVSQFTLYADCRKGCRPSFSLALKAKEAEELYNKFVDKLKKICSDYKIKIFTGKFRAYMQVNLCNDGPVTIILDK